MNSCISKCQNRQTKLHFFLWIQLCLLKLQNCEIKIQLAVLHRKKLSILFLHNAFMSFCEQRGFRIYISAVSEASKNSKMATTENFKINSSTLSINTERTKKWMLFVEPRTFPWKFYQPCYVMLKQNNDHWKFECNYFFP